MLIQEMARQGSLDLLARSDLGRLRCTQEGQPYIVPTYFAYADTCFYSFSTTGQKIDWMRANPLVCLQADEVVNTEHWASVIIFGRFEELPDLSEWRTEGRLAPQLPQKEAAWREPGYAKTTLSGTERPLVPVVYRIHIAQITGHRLHRHRKRCTAIFSNPKRPVHLKHSENWLIRQLE